MEQPLPKILFIPRTPSNVTIQQIKNVLSGLKLGTIKKIDLVKNHYQTNFQKIFIQIIIINTRAVKLWEQVYWF